MRAVSRVPVPSLRGSAAFPVPPLRGRAASPVPPLRGRAASPCCVFRCLFVESREYDSSHGASTLRAGLSYRAVPAFALRSGTRYCVPWQVPHPADLWRLQATRRCGASSLRTANPSVAFRCLFVESRLIYRAIPASVAPNRFYSRLRPGQPTSSVCARLSRRRRFCGVYVESREHF